MSNIHIGDMILQHYLIYFIESDDDFVLCDKLRNMYLYFNEILTRK